MHVMEDVLQMPCKERDGKARQCMSWRMFLMVPCKGRDGKARHIV